MSHQLARQLASECSLIVGQGGGIQGDFDTCQWLGKVRTKRRTLENVCHLNNVEFPEDLLKKWGLSSVAARMQSVDWWKRKLKTAGDRNREMSQLSGLHDRVQSLKKSAERKGGKLVIGYRYVSAATLAQHRENKRRLNEYLEAVVAVCETGETLSLKRIAAASVSNPVCRQAELICRLKGFEQWGIDHGMKCLFITLTCPSKYHATSAKYNRETPRQAQAYLRKIWDRFRAWLGRERIHMHGFRMAEPHKDGTPHWHLVLWFDSALEALVVQNKMRQMFLGDLHPEGDRLERGASKRRVRTEIIDHASGKRGVLSYVLPYITKNITGKQADGKSTFKDKGTSLDSNAVAERAIAYASLWRIRQFQQIGGPSVGVWRELRRIRDQDEVALLPEEVTAMHAAADAHEWADYMAASMDKEIRAWVEKSADLLAALVAVHGSFEAVPHDELLTCLNSWGEPDIRKQLGIEVNGKRILTRAKKWRIERKPGEAAPHVPAFGTRLEIIISKTFDEMPDHLRQIERQAWEGLATAKREAREAFQGRSPPLDLWQ